MAGEGKTRGCMQEEISLARQAEGKQQAARARDKSDKRDGVRVRHSHCHMYSLQDKGRVEGRHAD